MTRKTYRIVAALRTRADLLPTNEQIIRIGPIRIQSTRHGVERTHRGGIFVKGVEIGVVLLFHQLAQGELEGAAEVRTVVHL